MFEAQIIKAEFGVQIVVGVNTSKTASSNPGLLSSSSGFDKLKPGYATDLPRVGFEQRRGDIALNRISVEYVD